MIRIIDDVLSKEQCKKLISLKSTLGIDHMWGDTEVTKLSEIPEEIKNNNINFTPDWGEIVKWTNNSYQQLHFDDSSDITKNTSITYLNNDYDGGETYFEDGTIIKPKTGRTVIFDGKKYKHGVNKVNGVRYTLPVWYK